MPGGFQTILCKGVQLVPCEDDVIAVHQQIFRQDLPLLSVKIRTFPLLRRAECGQRVPLDGPISALKNFEQLGILFQSGAVGHGPALRHGLRLRFRARGFSPAAVHMHVTAHLIPWHHKACSMGAEHRICGIFKVMFRLVACSFDDLRCVVAGPAAIRRQGQPSTTAGIADHFHGVAAHGRYRRKAGQGSRVGAAFRRVKAALHALDIAHGAANVLHRHFQPEGILRL